MCKAAEKSLEELKGLRSTSEAQIAAGELFHIEFDGNRTDIYRSHPTTKLRDTFPHCLWHEECEIHRYCNRLFATPRCCQSSSKAEVKRSARSIPRIHSSRS